LTNINGKNGSLILTAYSAALQERGWLPEPLALQALQALTKGKGVVKDKARGVLALEGQHRPLPLPVLITQALAEEMGSD
jgi:hypothetical protein